MIDATITRLVQECPALKSVAGAVDLADIMEQQFAVPPSKRPAAFVMLAGEQASSNQAASGHTVQIVTESIAIAIAVGSGEQVGTAVARDTVKATRDAVMDCLLGWAPEDGLGVLTYGGLAMLALRPRVVWFQMLFSRQLGLSSS